MGLPKFDIYQDTGAPIFLKKKKLCVMSSLKFTLSDVTLFLPDNLCGLKIKYMQACSHAVLLLQI